MIAGEQSHGCDRHRQHLPPIGTLIFRNQKLTYNILRRRIAQ